MSYQVRRYNHANDAKHRSPEENFLRILWAIISWPFRLLFTSKKPKTPVSQGIDRGYIDSKWREIEELIQLGRPSNYSRAVLEADKLLDHILKEYRAPGTTMADRLKASQNKFSGEGYDAAWKAHKVRNELVHSSQFELMDYNARSAIANFKKAIDELI